MLEDDRNFFPKYDVSLVLTDKVAPEYPQIAELIKPVAAKLTNDVLLKLNAEIDVTGKEPAVSGRLLPFLGLRGGRRRRGGSPARWRAWRPAPRPGLHRR